MTSTRSSGDFMLLGGNDTLSGYPYSSVAGNQIIYGRGDLRFPFADVVLGGAIPVKVRGILFAEGAKVKFSNDLFPTRSEYSYGFGLQAWLYVPMNFEWTRTKFASEGWAFSYRIGMNF